MEHLGGVTRGGTFILVYSATTNRVVADFSLPYESIIDADPEVEEAAPQNGQSRPPVAFIPGSFNWIDKLDTIRDARMKDAVTRIRAIDLDFRNKSETFYRDIVQVATTAKGIPGSEVATGNGFLDNISNRDELIAAFGGRNQILDLIGGRQGMLGILGGRTGLVNALGGRNGFIDTLGGQQGVITAAGGRNGLIAAMGGRNGMYQALGGSSGLVNAIGGRNGLITAMGGRNGMYQALGGRSGMVQELGGRNGILQTLGGQQGLVEFLGRDLFVNGQEIRFNTDGTLIPLHLITPGGTGGTIIVPTMARSSAAAPSTATLADNVNGLGFLLENLDRIDKRSKAQEEQLKALNKAYDFALSALLNNMTSLTEDVPASSDPAIALERLGLQSEQFSKAIKLTNSRKALTALKKAHSKKPILKSLLDKVKI